MYEQPRKFKTEISIANHADHGKTARVCEVFPDVRGVGTCTERRSNNPNNPHNA
jgi:hypothetical protein